MKMSLCNTFRSYAILLSIYQLMIIDSNVRAFAIPRTTNTIIQHEDLDAEESSLLAVKNDFKTNDIKVFDHSSLQKLIPVKVTVEHEKTKKAIPHINLVQLPTVYTQDDNAYKTEKTHDVTNESEETTETAATVTKEATDTFNGRSNSTEAPEFPEEDNKTAEDKTAQIITSFDDKITRKNIDTTTIEGNVNTQQGPMPQLTESQNAKMNETLENTTASIFRNYITPPIKIISTVPINSHTESHIKDSTPKITYTEVSSTETNSIETTPAQTRSIKLNSTEANSHEATSDETNSAEANSTQISFIQTSFTQLSSTQTSSTKASTLEADSTEQAISRSNTDTSTIEITASPSATSKWRDTIAYSSTASQSSTNTAPSWKKYVEIDRKHTTTTADNTQHPTDNIEDMSKADTIESSVKLEKPNEKSKYDTDEIISPDKLKNELISFFKNALPGEKSQSGISSSPAETIRTTSETEISSLPITTVTAVDTSYGNTDRQNVVSSKRAGYLNYSAEPTTITEGTALSVTIEPLSTPNVITNATETTRPLFENETQNKRVSGSESQSQLAEDAIKEELLKEEMLNNYAVNAKRYRVENRNVGGNESLVNDTDSKSSPMINQTTQSDNGIDDKYSVKPISSDKTKNSSLYAVSPNYKPLKKMEIQPPKPFIRDPDDNSWRNESISSLGIVFKPKNSSKPFTQVLKNKTETLMNNLLDKDNKNEVPELRERLEKIAEMRKSKKKKTDNNGDTVYSEEDEEGIVTVNDASTPKTEVISAEVIPLKEIPVITTLPTPTISSVEPIVTTDMSTTKNANSRKGTKFQFSTEKAKKLYNVLDYYDSTDDIDIDYSIMNKIDLKKFTIPLQTTNTPISSMPLLTSYTKPFKQYLPERKPTIQYFPPRLTTKVKNNFNNYDNDFQRKVNMYTLKETTKYVPPTNLVTEPTYPTRDDSQQTIKQSTNGLTDYTPLYKTVEMTKNPYLTHPPRVTELGKVFETVNQDTGLSKPSYVIKHYGDLINEAIKDSDYDRSTDYVPSFTEAPLRGVTITEVNKAKDKVKSNPSEDYDYETQFRKDVLDKFVENFNQNSERFKVDFPIIYNSSVVHKKTQEDGKVLAASSAFMKRLYNNPLMIKQNDYLQNVKPYDPNCENITVELSPAYELHYYVPEQEEKEEVDPKAVTLPYGYRL